MSTNVGGALGGDTAWTAGTYVLTANVTLAGFTLTLDCAGGEIVVKSATGAEGIILDADGSAIQTANTSAANKVIFTSINDDDHGEVIAGSTGAPSRLDQSVPYVTVNNGGGVFGAASMNLQRCEFWYCTATGGGPLTWGCTDGPACFALTLYLRYIVLKCCGILSSTIVCGLIGNWDGTAEHQYASCSIMDVIIDATNRIDDAQGCAICLYGYEGASAMASAIFKNIYIHMPNNTVVGTAGIYVTANTKPATFENIYCDGDFTSGVRAITTGAAVQIISSTFRCVAAYSNTIYNGVYMTANTASTLHIYNCIFMHIAATTGGGVHIGAANVTLTEMGNGFHGNACDIFQDGVGAVAVDASDILTDPGLDLLPDGFTIDSDCVFPDGLAVSNLTDYEENGNDTFAHWSIDATTSTETGYEYATTDTITPGIYYTGTWATPINDTAFRMEPNWVGGVDVSYEFLTALAITRKMHEQRRPLQQYPRRVETVTLTEWERRAWYEHVMIAYRGTKFYAPIYNEPIRPTNAGSLATLTTINVAGGGLLDLYNLVNLTNYVVLYDIAENIDPEIVGLSAIADDHIDLTTAITGAFQGETTVAYPLMLASLDEISTEDLTNRAGNVKLVFREEF